MILPGISGSFILVLLGKYFYIMEAVKTFNIPVMLVFICGAAIGITSFSRVLSFALRRFHDITISVLAGFMLGSLNKVWPWKETIETYTDSHGIVKPLVEANIMPNQLVWEAVGLMVLLRHRLLLGKALDENIEIINYNKKRGSAASFFAVEPLFYSHSTPPYHKVVYTNASTA